MKEEINKEQVLAKYKEICKFLASTGLTDLEMFVCLTRVCKDLLRECPLPDNEVSNIFDNFKKDCLKSRNMPLKTVIERLKSGEIK